MRLLKLSKVWQMQPQKQPLRHPHLHQGSYLVQTHGPVAQSVFL
jgi:hypothetical protein